MIILSLRMPVALHGVRDIAKMRVLRLQEKSKKKEKTWSGIIANEIECQRERFEAARSSSDIVIRAARLKAPASRNSRV